MLREKKREREENGVNFIFTQCERCFEGSKYVEMREANLK